jgi:HAD superfamily hydrolase (TIGR01459 family)
MMTGAVPQILDRAGPFLENFDVLLCDVWGVLHGGERIFPAAIDALYAFGRKGGTVILVSNAPTPGDVVAQFLAQRGLPRDCWHDIVTSGSLALEEIARRGFERLYHLGPQTRDGGFFTRLPGRHTPLEAADAIACTGLVDDVNESVESYAPLLRRALDRGLPFVCANPDLVVDVSGRLYVCAGALGEAYSTLGGTVIWCGKPHPSAYGTAIARAETLRGGPVPRERIVGIGDALRTDITAAKNAGVTGLLVASGIHRHALMPSGAIDIAALKSLEIDANAAPVAVIDWFRW